MIARYDFRDSLVKTVYIRASGDTVSTDSNEYYGDGGKAKTISITIREGHADTSCWSYGRPDSLNRIRAVDCQDTTRLYSITHLDEKGRIARVGTYFLDSVENNAIVYLYDSNGYVVQVDVERAGLRTTRMKISNDAAGEWLTTEEFESSGALRERSTRVRLGGKREKVETFGADGKRISWFVTDEAGAEGIFETIGCDAS